MAFRYDLVLTLPLFTPDSIPCRYRVVAVFWMREGYKRGILSM